MTPGSRQAGGCSATPGGSLEVARRFGLVLFHHDCLAEPDVRFDLQPYLLA